MEQIFQKDNYVTVLQINVNAFLRIILFKAKDWSNCLVGKTVINLKTIFETQIKKILFGIIHKINSSVKTRYITLHYITLHYKCDIKNV